MTSATNQFRLLPCIRRWGVVGILLWLKCSTSGHDWHNTGPIYVQEEIEIFSEPVSLITKGRIKMRCARCESINLIAIHITEFKDGRIEFESPDGRIEKV